MQAYRFPVQRCTTLGVVQVGSSAYGFEVCHKAKTLGGEVLNLPPSELNVRFLFRDNTEVAEAEGSKMIAHEVRSLAFTGVAEGTC